MLGKSSHKGREARNLSPKYLISPKYPLFTTLLTTLRLTFPTFYTTSDHPLQYNIKHETGEEAEVGYITFFRLLPDGDWPNDINEASYFNKECDVIIYPDFEDFWTFSVRLKKNEPYRSYVAIQPHKIKKLKEKPYYKKWLEDQKKILQKSYDSLSKGLYD